MVHLRRNYYYGGREWPYKNVKPRIIAEKYMVDKLASHLNDYKFLCFNGNPKCFFVTSNRYTEKDLKGNSFGHGSSLRETYYDLEWNILPFTCGIPRGMNEIEKPCNYHKMLEISAILSQNIPFLRVDLYEIDREIYFGELTFFPEGGFGIFNPSKWDMMLGEWLNCPAINNL
jgi:hypothetical protein